MTYKMKHIHYEKLSLKRYHTSHAALKHCSSTERIFCPHAELTLAFIHFSQFIKISNLVYAFYQTTEQASFRVSSEKQSIHSSLSLNLLIQATPDIETNIRKTCPCNIYPLKPHLYIKKLRYAGVYLFLAHLSL